MNAPTLASLAADLASGEVSALALTRDCLTRAQEDPRGKLAFVSTDEESALEQAQRVDTARQNGEESRPFAGIPIVVKDLFDVQGQVTRAGSRVLDGPPAAIDAPAVARLRAAGFIVIGRSNMTEFAYSGLGMNPHYGTPFSPWKPEEERIAGGSTSGGAAAVSLGMAHAALGSDTGGSCRIPAAWCGLTGFKPTAERVPRKGAVPLSTTLDSIGTIARSVACCASLDAILADERDGPGGFDLSTAKFGVVTNIVLEEADPLVAEVYGSALERLRRAGAQLAEVHFEPFDRVALLNSKGGFPAAEAYAWHRKLLEARGEEYDPRVAVRIGRGAQQSAADYIELCHARRQLVAEAHDALAQFDALLMPTTPILPPRLVDLAEDREYGRVNLLALRNPTLINMIDGCAVSLPIADDSLAPVGLTVAGGSREDLRILAIAAEVEAVVSK